MQKIDQNIHLWAEKSKPTICELLPQATSADSFVNQLMPQLERSMQSAAQQIIIVVLKQNIIIQEGDSEAQQKISTAQTIANVGVKPLTTYGAQKILITALKQCPKEELPPSAADTIPQRAVPAVTTQQGPDVQLKDVLFYYEESMSMWVDKDKLQPLQRLQPSIMVKNSGTVEATGVEIAVSVDGGVEEKKTISKLAPGGASGYGFFLPATLEGGQHELIVRMTAKDDINLDNNVAKIPFTILVDGLIRNLKFSYVNNQRTVLSTPVDTNAIDTKLQLVATVSVSNEGRTPIRKADVLMSIDGAQPQKQTIYAGSRDVSFDINNLQPGKHEVTFTLEVVGDTNLNNNIVKGTIIVPGAEQPPAVEQPSNIDVGFKDAVFYYQLDPTKSIDKNAIEQAYEKFVDVSVTNFGSEEVKTVDVYVREDDKTFEVKRFLASDLKPGETKTRQFIQRDTFPSSLGSHKLVFRLEAKGDTNPANDVGVVNFNIIKTPEQQLWPDLKLWFTKDKLLEQGGKDIAINEVKTNKAVFGSVSLKNIAKYETSKNVVVIVKIDDKEILNQKIDEVWPEDCSTGKEKTLSIAMPSLTAGKH
ncbi:hypothetical protein HY484_01375 [Candidatus Woesearchaeota archaeon]|nr:hypothetical protein [Candidatus Woesearchaeota archaeon]